MAGNIHHPNPKSQRLAAADNSSDPALVPDGAENGNSLNGAASANGKPLTAKIKELVRLAQEQGYLTYNDINDALPDSMINPDDLDDLINILIGLWQFF